MIQKYLFNHVSEETAYLVKDYPYGFRLRCQIRYWLETTNAGDRFCSQTLNPKTSQWNKPKKSTYQAVGVMGLDELNHATWRGIMKGWTQEAEAIKFIEEIGGLEKLTVAQVKQYKLIIAISRTQGYLKSEIVNSTGWTKEEREAHDKQQAEQQKKIHQVFLQEMGKLA